MIVIAERAGMNFREVAALVLPKEAPFLDLCKEGVTSATTCEMEYWEYHQMETRENPDLFFSHWHCFSSKIEPKVVFLTVQKDGMVVALKRTFA